MALTASATDVSSEVGNLVETATVPPKYLSEKQFAGFFEESFEVRSFVPCDLPESTGYGQGYWIDSDWQSEFSMRYSELAPILNTDPAQGSAPGQIVYVEFVGKQVNPAYGAIMQGGEYGHLGQYDGEILVVELIDMVPIDAQRCKSK